MKNAKADRTFSNEASYSTRRKSLPLVEIDDNSFSISCLRVTAQFMYGNRKFKKNERYRSNRNTSEISSDIVSSQPQIFIQSVSISGTSSCEINLDSKNFNAIIYLKFENSNIVNIYYRLIEPVEMGLTFEK